MKCADKTLPVERRNVTAFDIVMGAAASRDWQPQHHDVVHARSMGLPDVIMNTATQTGWFHAFAMAWAGEGATIRRWKLKMIRPICPGTVLELRGVVFKRESVPRGEWLWLDIEMVTVEEVLSTMRVLLSCPSDPPCLQDDSDFQTASPPPLA